MSRLAAGAACAFALACIPYLNSLDNGFHYDDFHSIVNNPHIRKLEHSADFFCDARTFSVEPQNAMYRPLLLVTYALNYAFGEMQPAGYHLVNILLHGANAALLFLFLQQLGGNLLLAFCSAVFFAVTPLNAEAVNYVSSRSELLMAFFFLLACLAYVRFGRTGKWGWYALALVGAALALLSKSVAVVVVGALVLCDSFAGEGALRRRWRYYAPFVVLALLYIWGISQFIGKAIGEPVRPLAAQLWTQTKAVIHYLYLGGAPVRLSAEQQFFPSHNPLDPPVLSAALAVVSLVVLLLWQRRRDLRFALVWSALVLFPLWSFRSSFWSMNTGFTWPASEGRWWAPGAWCNWPDGAGGWL